MMQKSLACWAACFAGILTFFAAPTAGAATSEIKLARHPDYHDGKIVFSYLGNLWLVTKLDLHPKANK